MRPRLLLTLLAVPLAACTAAGSIADGRKTDSVPASAPGPAGPTAGGVTPAPSGGASLSPAPGTPASTGGAGGAPGATPDVPPAGGPPGPSQSPGAGLLTAGSWDDN